MKKHLGRLAIALVLVFVFGVATMPPALAQGPAWVHVSGNTLQTNIPVGDFQRAGPNFIGNSAPEFLICPGNIVPDPVTILGCDLSDNGFFGTIVADERVVRHLANPNKPPRFTFKSTQDFVGAVIIDGQPYFGEFTQTMSLTGELNQKFILNPETGQEEDICLTDPDYMENGLPQCGAKSFDGTWTIIGNSTGQLADIRGHGTLTWLAGDFFELLPGFYLPNIEYEGSIKMGANATGASLSISGSSDFFPDRRQSFLPLLSQ